MVILEINNNTIKINISSITPEGLLLLLYALSVS